MHFQILPNPFKSKVIALDQQPAGYVQKAQRELRKRSMNSLVWENASVDETLYYYDSVLTLSQSSATLYLQEQTEVHLSENTLVTIEPQDQRLDSQIRLKFTRGDLRARNPYATTKIETPEWSLNLDQGSEVSLRQTGKDNFEVEVVKGNLQFEKDNGTQAITENQVLKIEDNKVAETLSIQGDLKFQGPEYQRIYSPQPETQVPVAWIGEAERIEIIPLGKDSVVKEINPSQKTENLQLEPGKYTLRLVNNGKVSEAKEIEVWQTPTLQLLSPFPRDRVNTNENVSFVWSYVPEAKEYKIIMTDLATGKSVVQKVKDNFFQHSFQNEGNIQWKVIGLDAEGFEMPSAYSNQIFPRHEPFAAPRLKSPEIRVPASKPKPAAPQPAAPQPPAKKPSSMIERIWNLLVPTAFAEPAWAPGAPQPGASEPETAKKSKKPSDYEAVFAWEKVDGADLYTIEISDSTDFRNPKLSKVVKKTEFTWSHFALGSYYWRVAAGSSNGRMGVFSEPAKVNLEKLPEGSASSDGVLIRKKLDPDAERPKVETKTEEIVKSAPKPQFDETRFKEDTKLASDEQRDLVAHYLLEWSPVWTGWTLNGEDSLKAKLSGSSMGAVHFQTEQILGPKEKPSKTYFVDVFYAQYKWKASDDITYPFQDEQPFTDLRVQVLFGDNKSGMLRGAIVQTIPLVERQDLEKIQIRSAMTFGPSVYWYGNLSERWKSGHQLSVMAGNNIFALSNQNHFRYQVYKGESSALSLGFRVQEDLVFYRRSFSSGWAAGLTLGFEN